MNISKSKWVVVMVSAIFTLFITNPIIACHHSKMKNCHCAKKCHCAASKACHCTKPVKAS